MVEKQHLCLHKCTDLADNAYSNKSCEAQNIIKLGFRNNQNGIQY